MDASSVDRGKLISALAEYVCFLVDGAEPEDASEVKKYDARRRELHGAVGEALGFSVAARWPETAFRDFDNMTADHARRWKEAKAIPFGEFVEREADRLIDKLSDHYTSAGTIKSRFLLKHTIGRSLGAFKSQVEERIAAAQSVMDDIIGNWDAYCKDHKDEKVQVSDINSHDFNGYVGSARRRLRQMDEFAVLPREAYTAVAAKVYYDDNAAAVRQFMLMAEGIAFHAERLYTEKPYYRYKDKKGESR